ncbi:MAG: DUF3137 domain-containing protein [Candidatus Nomurabacteria bacterium]|jgi:hypothetical protein|nr:DUF3137 domain-containing protein [Candidatus Nomurabacteria bacterium]
MSYTGGLTNLDFSPLSGDVKLEDFTPEEIKAHGFDYPSLELRARLKKIAAVAGVVFFGSLVLGIPGLAFGAWLLAVPFVVLINMIPIAIIGSLVFYTIFWGHFPRANNLKWMMFAKKNGLVYHNPRTKLGNLANPNTSSHIPSSRIYTSEVGIDGVFFKRGTNSFDNLVDINSRTICFEHCKTIGSGKSAQSYYFNVVRYNFERKVPNILLDGLKNLNPMHGEQYNAQALRLEGDFNKHFKVFVPPSYHLDALQILTPDVMADLVDYAAEYDIELVDQYVYIATSRNLMVSDYASFTQNFFARISEIIKELSEQVDAYTDRHDSHEANSRLKSRAK